MLLLGGCESTIESLVDKGNAINNTGHDVAEAQLCKGYGVQVVPVRYRKNKQLTAAWYVICSDRAERAGEVNE